MAEYIDYFLNPLSGKHPSYIEDTYDFIHKISKWHVPVTVLGFNRTQKQAEKVVIKSQKLAFI